MISIIRLSLITSRPALDGGIGVCLLIHATVHSGKDRLPNVIIKISPPRMHRRLQKRSSEKNAAAVLVLDENPIEAQYDIVI